VERTVRFMKATNRLDDVSSSSGAVVVFACARAIRVKLARMPSLASFAILAALAADGGHSVLSPTPDAQMRPLVTDRPDLTESPVTVDAGHLQIEMDLTLLTLRPDTGRPRVSLDIGHTHLKIGLTDAVDLQFMIPSFAFAFDDDSAAPATSPGDLGVRLKWNLVGNDGADFALGVMPWVVIDADLRPVAGVIVPASFALPWDIGLGVMVVGNVVALDNGAVDGEGIVSASLSRALVGPLGGYVEMLAAGRPLSATGELLASTGLTVGIGEAFQVDVGARAPVIGNDDARLEAFVGLAARH
jgi:hypothetical protein